MRTLIIHSKAATLAKAIAEGAAKTSVEVVDIDVRQTPDPALYDLIFVGSKCAFWFDKRLLPQKSKNQLEGKNVALFGLCGPLGKKSFTSAIDSYAHHNAKVNDALSVTPVGPLSLFGMGKISDEDLARTRKFSERIIENNTATIVPETKPPLPKYPNLPVVQETQTEKTVETPITAIALETPAMKTLLVKQPETKPPIKTVEKELVPHPRPEMSSLAAGLTGAIFHKTKLDEIAREINTSSDNKIEASIVPAKNLEQELLATNLPLKTPNPQPKLVVGPIGEAALPEEKRIKVLVAYTSKNGNAEAIAKAIAEGAAETKVDVGLMNVAKEKLDLTKYDFSFLGCDVSRSFDSRLLPKNNEFSGKKIALFAAYGQLGESSIDTAISILISKGATVKSTFSSKNQGPFALFGRGKIKEEDIIRARGFGERTINNTFGLQIKKQSEKTRIKGYVK